MSPDKCNTGILVILRGLPGSGKSTLAKKIEETVMLQDTVICSADRFFEGPNGYEYKKDLQGIAHTVCQIRVEYFMQKGRPVIILDNTNIKNKAMVPYIDLAEKFNYSVYYILVGGLTPQDIECYAQRQQHGVPLEHIERMASEFEHLMESASAS